MADRFLDEYQPRGGPQRRPRQSHHCQANFCPTKLIERAPRSEAAVGSTRTVGRSACQLLWPAQAAHLEGQVSTRRLGNSDLNITPVGFGAWAIGGTGYDFAWGKQDDADS